jgi:nicotinamidase-related amidase
MSNNFTSHFSADDAALLLIDFQPQMFMGVESHDRNAIKNNLQIIAKSAKLQQDWGRQETYQGVMDIMKAHTAFGVQVFYSKWALGGHDSALKAAQLTAA